MTSQIFLETAMIYSLIWSKTARNCLSLKSVPLSVASQKTQQLTSDQNIIIIHLLKIKTINFNKLTDQAKIESTFRNS